jgi:predicted metalloprotease with PDZ domain
MPHIHFTVAMPDPASHNFEVTAQVSGVGADAVLVFAAWTPGSYKIREFGKNVNRFSVKGGSVELLDKQSYEITRIKGGKFTASFQLYANELSVRTPHLDDTHGFFLGTNVLPYLEGDDGLPAECEYTVTIKPFTGWKVATSLPSVRGKANTWRAESYDVLGDTPFEIGTHEVHSFEVRGIKHDIAFYGYGNYDVQRILKDTRKIVAAQARHFGGLPYDYYLFIHHMTPDSGGGLEHLNSCVCGWPSWKFNKEEDYQRFIRLVSHEFFHTWNVKRIRPEILGPFDYSREQHTRALWVMEGLTQYYERLWCTRAGVTPVQTLLDAYAETIEREDDRPGRKVMSLEHSSWLAWTKLYHADENFPNTAVSYYSRGAQVGMLLDAKIRTATGGRKSLDDVMKLAFKRYGWPKPGFPERGFEDLCEEVAGVKLTKFWSDHVRGTRELDYGEFLETFGLVLERTAKGAKASHGMNLNGNKVAAVFDGSPAAKAGMQAKDEIIAVNGHRVTEKTLTERLDEHKPGQQVELAVFRRERLVTHKFKLGSRPAGKLKLTLADKPTAEQKRNRKSWLWADA